MYSGLLAIQKRLGKDRFPLVIQHYYPNWREMSFTPEYPIVVKVGHIHAGYGKMKLDTHESFQDLASIMALHDDYCTAERYMNGNM
jgi:hypothetical protein